MMKLTKLLGPVCGLACILFAGCIMAEEITDPDAMRQDADFNTQGEYAGTGTLFGDEGPIGVQVVALGDGKFDAYVLQGGLPGAGWKKGAKRVRLDGARQDATTTLSGEFQGKIADGALSLTAKDGKGTAALKRTERKSDTLGLKPPAGAVVLFDGTKATADANFDHVVLDKDNLMSGTTTTKKFGDYTLHVELRLSYMPHARGQGRSNSGVYIHDAYEIQVLDSFGLEGANNECGGFYSIKAPEVNMCLPPLVWQTYDVDFTAPRYDASGAKTSNARISVRHNGVVIHDNVELPKGTPGRQKEGPAPRPIHLQGHGNKVEYRNVWLVEKK